MALIQQLAVSAFMALGWRHEADGAVSVFMVVPLDQQAGEFACGSQVG